jgi:hypothetical protein
VQAAAQDRLVGENATPFVLGKKIGKLNKWHVLKRWLNISFAEISFLNARKEILLLKPVHFSENNWHVGTIRQNLDQDRQWPREEIQIPSWFCC